MKNITLKVEMITPAKAKEYLLKNTINRPLSDKTINYYASIMAKGEWSLTPEGIAFDEFGRLLDGQHRLSAIIKSGVSVVMQVTSGYDHEVFSKLNTGKTRTASDVLSISDIKNATHIAAGIKKYMIVRKGYNVDVTQRTDHNITNNDVLLEYELNSDFYQNALLISVKYYSIIRLLSVSEYFSVYCFLVKNRNHKESKVEAFFDELNGSSDFYAVNAFRRKVILSKTSNQKISASVRFAYLIKTWNAYVTGKDIKVLKYDSAAEEYPKFI